MNYTGRGIEGPGSDLIVLDGSTSAIAVAYRDVYQGRAELGAGLSKARAFMEQPKVDGLLALIGQPDPLIFAYDRKGGCSVRELILAHRQLGRPAGERAGLELLLQGAEVLADGAGRAAKAGLRGHGDLSPWRLLVDSEGYTDVFGYGLPPLALLDFLQERADAVPADALRYAPPERLELQPEDIVSDLFSLALVAVELIAGQPVFDGTAEQVIEALLSGEAAARIEKLCPDLPDPTLDLLCICCELDPTQRYADAEEVIRVVKRCLRDAEGPSLKGALDAALGVDVLGLVGPQPAAAKPEPAPKAAPKASAKAAPEPEPEPEPPADTDPLGPPPALRKLAAEPDLAAVRERAAAVVARVDEIVRRTTEIFRVAKEDSAGAPAEIAALTRRIQDAVGKAEKAASAARRSAGLVELDDDASDAIITLGLVTGAEQQAQAAIEAAREWLDEIHAGMVEVKRSRARVGELGKRAQVAAGAAAKALAKAEDLVTELERGLSSGELSAPGVEPAAEVARRAIIRARGAGSKANDAVHQARATSEVVDAEAYASSAEAALDAVSKALVEIEKSVDKARKAEAAGLESARADVLAQANAATEAATTARSALDRARKAVEKAPDEEARTLVKRAAPLADKAAASADQARSGSDRSASATHSGVVRELLVPTRRAAHEASDAADQVQALCKRAIALAGAAAQAAEALASSREAAQKLQGKASQALADAVAHVESLLHDTDEVQGDEAVAERTRAAESLAEARERAAQFQARLERFLTIDDPDDAEADLRRVKAAAAAVHESCDQAERACVRCRELADDEIREILTERRRLASLERYAGAARAHAGQCREAVDRAWARYRGLPTQITKSDIKRVRTLLKQAFDVIDIAEFQAGEAEQAASEASRQGDPAEAAGYAESAASFWERISEDLPEALTAIDEAESLATAEIKAIDEARGRTEKAASQAAESRDAIRAAAAAGTELAEGWAKHKVIAGALERIRKADVGLDDGVAEAEYARDRAASSDRAADATEMIPVGEAVAQRFADLQAQAERALDELKKAVQAARADAEEVDKLRAEVASLANDTLGTLKKVKASQERLDKALSEHGATGVEATGWQEALEECLKKARIGRKRAKEAADSIKGTAAVKEARALADRARKGAAMAAEQVTPAAEAEAEGIKAALAEAEARAQAEERRKAEARSAAEADAGRAESALEAVTKALAESEDLVVKAGSRDATALRDEAAGVVARLQELARAARKSSELAASASQADAVLTAALDAREAAQRATATSRDALSKLGEARTLAHAAAEQAAALGELREQMAELAARADGAVKLAKEQSGFLDELLDRARTDATRALRGQADDALASVRKAATKVHTAAPMLAEAESLDVAMHMLKAARRAVDAAVDAADQVPRLVAEAERRLVVEAEEAKRALEKARSGAREPLALGQQAVDKVHALVTEAQASFAEFDDDATLVVALADLSAELATVQELQHKAEAVAEPAAEAATEAAALKIRDSVQAAVDAVIQGAAGARKAREAFDAAVADLVATRERIAKVQADTQASLESFRARLGAAREAYAALEAETDGAPIDPLEASDALDHVEEALAEANDRADKAIKAGAAVAVAEGVQAVDAAVAESAPSLQAAVSALDAFDKALSDGRDEVRRMVREAEQRKAQEAEAARERAREDKEARARAEREALRSARPGVRPGLRPAGPPRGGLPSRPGGRSGAGRSSGDDDDGADAPTTRARPVTDRAGAPDRRLRRPGAEGRSGEVADRGDPRSRLRRPSRDEGPATSGRGPLRRSREPDAAAPADDAPADRRLRRPSRSVDGASLGRSLRRPGEPAASDDAPADRRLRRPGQGGEVPADRRLRRPSRSGEAEPEAPLRASRDEERDDLRARLRERRASRMASGGTASSGGADERPVRPAAGPSGRPPLRPPRRGPPEPEPEPGSDDEAVSGAELLRRRTLDRSTRRPAPDEGPAPRPRRSIDDLRSRMRLKDKGDDQD